MNPSRTAFVTLSNLDSRGVYFPFVTKSLKNVHRRPIYDVITCSAWTKWSAKLGVRFSLESTVRLMHLYTTSCWSWVRNCKRLLFLRWIHERTLSLNSLWDCSRSIYVSFLIAFPFTLPPLPSPPPPPSLCLKSYVVLLIGEKIQKKNGCVVIVVV